MGRSLEEILLEVEKPSRYLGGERNIIVKDHRSARVRAVLAFPDVYEIGMSHLGLRILYKYLNARPGVILERCFTPWPDMEKALRENRIPLSSLETRTPLSRFDVVGFSLQYELGFTNVLMMLDLAGIPFRAADRDMSHPLVVGGGPVAFSPEPVADFFDAFLIGDGEEAFPQLLEVYADLRDGHLRLAEEGREGPAEGRLRILKALARLPGVPEGLFIEVQVRTAAMHREAELGIAAHWSYKEGGTAEHAAERARLQRALTQHLIPRDHIFVLTPRGDIIELPEGATTLDFAFHVHTTLGLSFRAAKVNGSIVPLDHALENGDIVEILRHADPRPSPRWMQLLRTASARSRLKRYLAMKSGERAPPDVREKITVSEKRAVKKKIALVARVEGLIPMPVRFARCCKPDAGGNPPLAGVIGRRGDVCVHAVRCKMLNNVNPGRRVGVKWGERS